MNTNMKICLWIVIIVQLIFIKAASKKPVNFTQRNPGPKYDNPSFVRDRFRTIIKKPQMPDTWKYKNRPPFHPAWMDYCDPYHCNDYHKTACGLNRNTLKFKWFQSRCHMILNNQCSTYRGTLKYDPVDTKFCFAYVMFLRSRCGDCKDDHNWPICGMSDINHEAVWFKNKCAFDKANCNRETFSEYREVDPGVCAIFEIHQKDPAMHYPFPVDNKED